MGWNVEIWSVLYLLLRTFICRIAMEVWHSGIPVSLWDNTNAVSYTHLTLPTICSV